MSCKHEHVSFRADRGEYCFDCNVDLTWTGEAWVDPAWGEDMHVYPAWGDDGGRED